MRLAFTALEDRTTPSSVLSDFTGPIQSQEDLRAHLRESEPFVGPELPPDYPRAFVNPVMPPDWKLDLLPQPLGDPIALPPIIPLVPPYLPRALPYEVPPNPPVDLAEVWICPVG